MYSGIWCPVVQQRDTFLKILTLNIYVVGFSWTLVFIHQNMRHNTPEESNFNFQFNLILTMPCLRWLVTEISRWSTDSITGLSSWDVWWKRWPWEWFLSEYFGFTLSLILHQCPTHILTSTNENLQYLQLQRSLNKAPRVLYWLGSTRS